MSAPLTNDDIFLGFARFLNLHSVRLLVLLTGYDIFLTGFLWLKALPQLAPFPLTMAVVLWISFYGVRWLGVYRALMVKTPLFSTLATVSGVFLSFQSS
jgi:hypothetical protein